MPAPLSHVAVRVGPTVALVAFGVRAEWRALTKLSLPPWGTYVVVSGDRGHDVGIVVEYGVADGSDCDATWKSRSPPWRVPFAAPRKPRFVPSARVLRLATVEEARNASELCVNCFHFARPWVQQLVNDLEDKDWELRVLDVEVYAQNVIIYFCATQPVRISQIVKRLYLFFKCRVWMQQVSLDGSRISTTPTRRPRNAAAA